MKPKFQIGEQVLLHGENFFVQNYQYTMGQYFYFLSYRGVMTTISDRPFSEMELQKVTTIPTSTTI